MTTNDTKGVTQYRASAFPRLGETERFIVRELANVAQSLSSIITALQAMEARMNSDGLP